MLAATTVVPIVGKLSDLYGRKPFLLGGVAVFVAGSGLCGAATSMMQLVVFRGLQGVGAGAMMICQFAILSQQFREPAARSRAFAVWGVVAGIGLGFGPLAGAAIVALADWRWVFLVHAPLTLLTLGLVHASVQESRDPAAHRLDVAGMLTLTLAVFALGSIGAAVVGIPVILAGLVLLLMNGAMSRRTASGRELYRRARGFREYMVTAETDRAKFAEETNLFEKYLPYAIVFRCTEKWAKAFEGIYTQPPQWYTGPAGVHTFRPSTFTSNLGAMSSQAASVMASAPRSSGGSGFSGGSSGGGFGGGGGGGF